MLSEVAELSTVSQKVIGAISRMFVTEYSVRLER